MGFAKSCAVVVLGFIVGMSLAEIGEVSARTLLYFGFEDESLPHSAGDSKIEPYWARAGLGAVELEQFVNTAACKKTTHYAMACLNAVISAAHSVDKKIVKNSLTLEELTGADVIDEKSEKELLFYYADIAKSLDYSKLVNGFMSAQPTDRRGALAAEMINAFFSVYHDPHTYILPTSYYEEVSSQNERTQFFVGITYEKENDWPVIRKVSKNSDADLSGLRLNDVIESINGVHLKSKKMSEVSRLLRDESTAKFIFTVRRQGRSRDIVLNRSYRKLSYVQYEEIQGSKKYAVITLAKFSRGVCEDVSAQLRKAIGAGVAGVVLDMRDNPGGSLSEAGCIQGLFLGQNKVAYYIEYIDELMPNELVLTDRKQVYRGPLAVLVNAYSASAAEVVAGGLQAHKRALVVGERTFGKGTFQEPEPWVYNDRISLYRTKGFYLLPDRRSAQIVGIQPDVGIAGEASAKREADLFYNPLLHRSFAPWPEVIAVESESAECQAQGLAADTGDRYLVEGIARLSCAAAQADRQTEDRINTQ